MANPISNSNLPPVGQGQVNRNQQNGDERGTGAAANRQDVAATGQQDAVSVSRAAEVLNKVPAERGEGGIENSEQAFAVATKLRDLFAGNSSQALAAQGGNASSGMLGLLQAG